LFGKHAGLEEGPSPPLSEVPEPWETLFPEPEKPGGFRFLSTTPEQTLAWTRGLTAMRAQMTGDVAARIAIGGKLDKYMGLYPGVVEEAWMSLMTRQPLYLVGAFGGATHALIEALQGDAASLSQALELSASRSETVELARERGMNIDEQVAGSRSDLNPIGSLLLPETIGKDVANRAAGGLANALNNGLDDEQNKELFRSSDPHRIAELILTGLSEIFPKPSAS
jgi:hypothetical protein